MGSIIEGLVASLPQVSADYAANIRIPAQQMSELGNDLREKGGVFFSFEQKHVLKDKTLVAVDGGRVSQQLAGGDLVVVGATLGDGASSVSKFGENYISESFATVVAHTSKVENEFAGRMMSALELRVLARAKTDYKIIDGAYLANVSEVLFGLISENEHLIEETLKFNRDGRISSAMEEVLHPPRDNSSGLVAVSKSDSSFIYSKKLLGADHNLSHLVSDRNLASFFLQPGEFLFPRLQESNPVLIKALAAKIKSVSAEVKPLVADKEGLLRRLSYTTQAEEELLWTTYFKPTRWTAADRAIKIEFVFYPSNKGSTVEEHARNLVQMVDDDIVNNTIREPFSQYLADIRAKQVSLGVDVIKNHLLNNVENSAEAQGLLRGYRT